MEEACFKPGHHDGSEYVEGRCGEEASPAVARVVRIPSKVVPESRQVSSRTCVPDLVPAGVLVIHVPDHLGVVHTVKAAGIQTEEADIS